MFSWLVCPRRHNRSQAVYSIARLDLAFCLFFWNLLDLGPNDHVLGHIGLIKSSHVRVSLKLYKYISCSTLKFVYKTYKKLKWHLIRLKAVVAVILSIRTQTSRRSHDRQSRERVGRLMWWAVLAHWSWSSCGENRSSIITDISRSSFHLPPSHLYTPWAAVGRGLQ